MLISNSSELSINSHFEHLEGSKNKLTKLIVSLELELVIKSVLVMSALGFEKWRKTKEGGTFGNCKFLLLGQWRAMTRYKFVLIFDSAHKSRHTGKTSIRARGNTPI